MKSFLLVYDRKAGKLLHFEEYSVSERERALAERFAWEEREREHADIEVVVLNAESRAVLERTHGRYFKTLAELAEQA